MIVHKDPRTNIFYLRAIQPAEAQGSAPPILSEDPDAPPKMAELLQHTDGK
jgi:hypothetical protein